MPRDGASKSNGDRGGATALRSVVKSFGRVLALDGVDVTLPPGRVTALLGPNGAGKTTAVRSFLGLSRPDAGTVSVLGGDPLSPAIRCRLGAMLQIAAVPQTLTVGEHLELFRSYYPAPMSRSRALALAGLEALERRRYGDLSGGQQRRLLFALAVCGDPDLLFLDEPTTGLDVEARRALWEQVRALVSRGRTVLLTTHDMQEADALADRIVVLAAGRVVAEGSPSEIKRRAASKRIRCRTRIGTSEVAAWAGVHQAVREGDELSVLASDAELVVRRLLEGDPELADLEVAGARLEEAFLALTRDPPAASLETPEGELR